MRRFVVASLAALAVLVSAAGFATEYPSRFVTIVVPFAAGSGSDTAARIIGRYLGPRLGQSVVVENRVGATGAIAATAVARAAPDGYTLLLGTNSTHGSNSALYKSIAYDPIKDFEPVAHTGLFNQFLLVNPALPIATVADLVAYGRANPGTLTYAGGNAGGIVMAETFAKASGVQLVKVAYRSNPAALTDVIAGRVSLMFADMSSSVSFVRAGSLRPLAVTTKARSQLFPELPTISETAVDGYDLAPWTGLFAPAGTPGPVIARLNQEVNAVLALPDVQERFAALGIEATPMAPDAFAAFVRAEVAKWSQLVRDVGLQPD